MNNTFAGGRYGFLTLLLALIESKTMAIEIERKYLVKNDDWKPLATKSSVMKQGYLQTGTEDSQTSSVRIRISDGRAHINIKSTGLNVKRLEFEYEIPAQDAEQMLSELCAGLVVEKTRYYVPFASHVWEVDVFSGENTGLKMAEVELDSEDEAIEIPQWISAEVTRDKRYYNSYLIKHPYRMWNN